MFNVPVPLDPDDVLFRASEETDGTGVQLIGLRQGEKMEARRYVL